MTRGKEWRRRSGDDGVDSKTGVARQARWSRARSLALLVRLPPPPPPRQAGSFSLTPACAASAPPPPPSYPPPPPPLPPPLLSPPPLSRPGQIQTRRGVGTAGSRLSRAPGRPSCSCPTIRANIPFRIPVPYTDVTAPRAAPRLLDEGANRRIDPVMSARAAASWVGRCSRRGCRA